MGRGKKEKLPPKKVVVESPPPQACSKPIEEWPVLLENELCDQFDKHVSVESENVEGIQAVRDLFTSISKLEKRIEKSSQLLREQQLSLQNENSVYSETRQRDTEELNKRKGQKDRLQALCDELSKNKERLVDEAKKSTTDDQAKRQTMNDEFLVTISSISARLDESSAQRLKHAEENDRLKSQLREALAQYQAMEDDYDAKLKQIDEKVASALSRFSIQEKAYLEKKEVSDMWQDRVTVMSETEIGLRKELSSFADRFEQFQQSMTKSNEMFVTCKASIEEMSKTIKVLEVDNADLSKKASFSNATLVAAKEETGKIQAEVEKVRLQSAKLIGLVTVLEADIAQKQRIINKFEKENYSNEDVDVAAIVTTILDNVVRQATET